MEAVAYAPRQHDCGDRRSPSAYGLTLRSFLPLAAATRHHGAADVEVRRGSLTAVAAGLRALGCDTRVARDEIHLLLPGTGTFLVRGGREIVVDPDPAADERLLERAILGPVMAALLQQRGFLVLHASAVEMDGVAVAFLGGCGTGKSTIAAALHRAGYGFLADDIVAVRCDGGVPRILPAIPQLKLWPDAVVAVGGDPERLARIDPQFTKRWCAITERFRPRGAVPLGCLFVLCPGESARIVKLSPREAFLELVTHSYGVRWLQDVAVQGTFRARCELARQVPVRRLERPDDLQRLPAVVRMVEESRGVH